MPGLLDAPAEVGLRDDRPARPLLGGWLSVRGPAAGEPRRDRWWELALFLGVLLLAAFTPARTASGEPNAPGMEALIAGTGGGLCIYRRVTGVECGGCGLTRGFVQLAHGDLREALRLNPMAPLLFMWVVWRAVELLVLLGLRRELRIALAPAWSWRFWATVILGLAALAAIRLGVHLCG